MQDVEDEPLFCERVAGLDIAKAMVEVTIRVPSDTTAGRRQQETRTFGTTRRELESLGDWLACWGVTKIGMEATGSVAVRPRITRPRRSGNRPYRPVTRCGGRHSCDPGLPPPNGRSSSPTSSCA